jgi:hypothetical protein
LDEAYVIESQGKLADFVELYIDGEKVDKKYYQQTEGSTVLTVLSQVLDKDAGRHTIGIEFREDYKDKGEEGTLKRSAQNYTISSKKKSSSNNSSSSSGSDSDSSTGSGSSSSASSNNASTISGSVENAESTITAALENGYNISQINLSFDHILRAALLNKYYGQNILIAAIMQSDFGLMIDMSEVPVLTTDFDMEFTISNIEELAPEFNTLMAKANGTSQLGFNAILNFNVGESYIGKTAYVYRLNSTATGYDLISTTATNVIGNVAFTSDTITDFIILIEK